MRKKLIWLMFSLLLLPAIFATVAKSVGGETQKGNRRSNSGLSKTTGIHRPFWTPNRIGNYITNNGQLVSHIPTNNAGMEWPIGSGNTINYASGIWVAGVKNGQIVAASGEFAVEFQPGPIVGHRPGVPGTAANPNDPRYKVYIINDTDVDDPAANPDYINWPASDGAPVIVNPDGSTRPGLIGNSTTWSVFNDLDQVLHDRRLASPVMGIEVQQTTWAFNRIDAFGDMMFFKFKIINKSGVNIDSSFVSLWGDIDVGDAQDLVGCDTTLSLGYVYKTRADGLYGATPPAIGYDFFQGPIVPSPGDTALVSGRKVPNFKNLPMSSFSKYINGGPPQYSDPGTAKEAYSFMNGFDRVGNPIINPLTNQPTKFWHTGDPATGSGWLDDEHRDKRILMNCGPFTLADGDTQEVVAGIVIAQGADVASTIRLLKQADQSAQAAYDNNFILPALPPAPVVQASTAEGAILLKWGERSEAYNALDNFHVDENGEKTFYTFQGYNVYQLDELNPSRNTTVRKISTFDLIDGVKEIRDEIIDEATGSTVNRVVQKGDDSGVARFLRLTRDELRGKSPLIPNRRYYYAVTAYGYNPFGSPKLLESPIKPILAIPVGPPLGSRMTSAYNDSLAATHIGNSDGAVQPIVVDPAALTGDSYEVRFRDTGHGIVYDLWNVAKNVRTDSNQTHQGGAGELNYPIRDGVLVQVFGPPPGMKGFEIPSGARRWTFANADFGLEGLSGAMGMGFDHWFSSSTVTPPQLRNVLIKLAGTDTDGNILDPNDADASFGYRYLRRANQPAAKPEFAPFIVNPAAGFAYQDYKKNLPFAAYNAETNPPTRLMVGYLENNIAGGRVNGRYWPPYSDENVDNTASTGPREWFYIFAVPYSETPDPALTVDILNTTVPMMWFGTPNRRGSNIAFEAADEFLIIANHVNSPADKFAFTTMAPTKNDAVLAKQQLQLVNVFPNPYTGFNVEERDPINRFVTFTHLTPAAQIRIYSLTGELVRVISHSDGTQLERWNLRNASDVPVASGIYIAHLELPGVGERILKLAVFQPEERLDIF